MCAMLSRGLALWRVGTPVNYCMNSHTFLHDKSEVAAYAARASFDVSRIFYSLTNGN